MELRNRLELCEELMGNWTLAYRRESVLKQQNLAHPGEVRLQRQRRKALLQGVNDFFQGRPTADLFGGSFGDGD